MIGVGKAKKHDIEPLIPVPKERAQPIFTSLNYYSISLTSSYLVVARHIPRCCLCLLTVFRPNVCIRFLRLCPNVSLLNECRWWMVFKKIQCFRLLLLFWLSTAWWLFTSTLRNTLTFLLSLTDRRLFTSRSFTISLYEPARAAAFAPTQHNNTTSDPPFLCILKH